MSGHQYFSYGTEDIAFREKFAEYCKNSSGPHNLYMYFYIDFCTENIKSRYPNLHNSHRAWAICCGMIKEYCPYVLDVSKLRSENILTYDYRSIENFINQIDDNKDYSYAITYAEVDVDCLLYISNEKIANMLRIAYGFEDEAYRYNNPRERKDRISWPA